MTHGITVGFWFCFYSIEIWLALALRWLSFTGCFNLDDLNSSTVGIRVIGFNLISSTWLSCKNIIFNIKL